MNKIVVNGKLIDAWTGRDGVFYMAFSSNADSLGLEVELTRWVYEQDNIQITLDKKVPIKIRESV